MNEVDTVLRARWIIPVCSPPIEDAMIRVRDGKVAEVGPWQPGSHGIDLGDVALLPGLVNAHTHLEFSDLETPVGTQGESIATWLGKVVRTRGKQSLEDKVRAVELGLNESLQSGTALIGEIATMPWPIDSIATTLRSTHPPGVRIQVFSEVLGLSPERSGQLIVWAQRQLDATKDEAIQIGISPHAPYTCPQDLLVRCLQLATERDAAVAMHVAESIEERQLLETGEGPLREAFETMGLPVNEHFPAAHQISDVIDALGTAPRSLLVHGNYLTDDEIDRLARVRGHVSAVYCPRTHAFFGHAKHPVGKMLSAGINVALGTDSRASNPDLQLWKEVRFLLQHRQDLSPRSILAMATLAGGRALGRAEFGRLAPGASARLCSLETSASNETQFWASLAESEITPVLLNEGEPT